MRRLLLTTAVALALAACSSGSTPPTGKIDGLQTFTEDPKPRHATEKATYDHTPPAGGQHWPEWLRCGVYTEPVPNEFAVHSQEHGAVWLTYQPGSSEGDVAALVALAQKRPDYVIVSPYPGQPGRFMASTWGAQLSVDTAADVRLKTFVDTYAGGGQGGEKGADCAKGMLPDEARAAFDKAST